MAQSSIQSAVCSPHSPIPPSQREALYVSPLLLAGTFTASIKKLLALRQWSGWIAPTSGVLLVGFGVISLLSRLVPIS